LKITKVAINRKFNLGNYESLDAFAEAELSEKDNAVEVWTVLRDNAEMWFTDQQRKKKEPSAEAKKVAEQITSGATEKPKPQESADAKLILSNFPLDLANLLEISELPKLWYLKAVHFLGTEKFAAISQVVRQMGGKYVSEGKTSHWEVPK
jgi:hypothetical protein